MRPTTTRDITRLAVPAFLTLIAEPVFLLVDTAIVGRIDTTALAALGVASSVLLTAASVFVFLAYGTTAVVARRDGAGDRSGALAGGIDGLWLAAGLGAGGAVVLAALAGRFASALGADGAVLDGAETYLRISAWGLPGMLAVLAASGVLRGLQDTRTPLVVATAGFGANAVLNWALVFPAGLGLAGLAGGIGMSMHGAAAPSSARTRPCSRWAPAWARCWAGCGCTRMRQAISAATA